MPDVRELLRRTRDSIAQPGDVLRSVIDLRDKKDSKRRLLSFLVGLTLVVVAVGVFLRELSHSATTPRDQLPAAPVLDAARLAPGPHSLELEGMVITFAVPDGWRGATNGVVDSDLGADAPVGAALSFWIVTNIYENPCRWNGSLAKPAVGSTVNDLVAGLANQKDHPSGQRIKAQVDGHAATELRMAVPDDLALSTCWNGEFRSWQSHAGDRSHQGPGQIDQLFILNVEGRRLVIDASFFPGTSDKDRGALFDMVRTVRIA
jgi:hypothetical protein